MMRSSLQLWIYYNAVIPIKSWFSLALKDGTSQLNGLLKIYDKALLLWESTAANSLATISTSRPYKNVKSITKRDNANCQSCVKLLLFISPTCTTAAAAALIGRKPQATQCDLGM